MSSSESAAAGLHGGTGDTVDATYARAGFGGAVPRGVRPAIVVVDLTKGFTDPAYPTGADLSPVVAATTELINVGRPAGVPVVFTTVSYSVAEIESGGVAWLRKVPGLRVLLDGTPAAELDARLPVLQSDHVINKKGASVFFGTGLAALLTGLRVDTVLVCGATTSGCVRASVVDAMQSGFDVLVPADCVGDRAEGPHRANLFDIGAKYGEVIDQADALGYLGALAPRSLIAGSPSAGSPSAGSPSAGSPSAGSPSAGSPSAGSPSAGSPSAGSPSAGSPVIGSRDGAPGGGTPGGGAAGGGAAGGGVRTSGAAPAGVRA